MLSVFRYMNSSNLCLHSTQFSRVVCFLSLANWRSTLYFKMLFKNTGLDWCPYKALFHPLFCPLELNRIDLSSEYQYTFTQPPPGIETLICHLMDLFISYLTPYNHAEWNLAFRKFSVMSYVKEILVVNKHLKQLP